MIHDTVLNGRRQPPSPPPPAAPAQHHGNDPGSVLDEMDRWAAKLDTWTEQYAEVVSRLGPLEYEWERAKAMARERAKVRTNTHDRRTNDDLDADVLRSTKVHEIAMEVVRLQADARSLFAKMKNAEAQVSRLQSHAKMLRTINPWTP